MEKMIRMVRIQDKLSEIVKGVFRVEVEDKNNPDEKIEFELKPTEGDKSDIFFNYKKMQESTSRFEEMSKKGTVTEEQIKLHNKMSRELIDSQDKVIRDILTRSYPDFTIEQVNGIMLLYSNEILMELYMFWGLINKQAVDAIRKKQMEEIKKLSGEGENPEKKPLKNVQQKSDTNLPDNS